MKQNYHHIPVMLEEVMANLKVAPDKFYIDATLGGGGHAIEIAQKIQPKGKIIGIDLDPKAVEVTREKAKRLKLIQNIILVKQNFTKIKKIAYDNGLSQTDGILLDLGLSSGQLQDQQRGFSFLAEGRLDMRFSGLSSNELNACHLVNKLSQKELTKIFSEYGQEPLAKEIARRIIFIRKKQPIIKPRQLVEIVRSIYKKSYRKKSKINPATKVFQAIRIAVNNEIENLKTVLPQAVELLDTGGRLVIISYHSLEDKIVKHFFAQEAKGCICPPQRPTCQCRHKKSLKIITKKPLTPSEEEILENPRGRSAKMRVAEKV